VTLQSFSRNAPALGSAIPAVRNALASGLHMGQIVA
jgi:hypothetical protein